MIRIYKKNNSKIDEPLISDLLSVTNLESADRTAILKNNISRIARNRLSTNLRLAGYDELAEILKNYSINTVSYSTQNQEMINLLQEYDYIKTYDIDKANNEINNIHRRRKR